MCSGNTETKSLVFFARGNRAVAVQTAGHRLLVPAGPARCSANDRSFFQRDGGQSGATLVFPAALHFPLPKFSLLKQRFGHQSLCINPGRQFSSDPKGDLRKRQVLASRVPGTFVSVGVFPNPNSKTVTGNESKKKRERPNESARCANDYEFVSKLAARSAPARQQCVACGARL
jgi:hypothetical protein